MLFILPESSTFYIILYHHCTLFTIFLIQTHIFSVRVLLSVSGTPVYEQKDLHMQQKAPQVRFTNGMAELLLFQHPSQTIQKVYSPLKSNLFPSVLPTPMISPCILQVNV